MKPIVIFEDDSELATFEAINKGYRGDVIVQIGDNAYKVYITSMTRLLQDFEQEVAESGFYLPEHNTIIVQEVTRSEIECTIERLYRCKYFESINALGV